MDTVYDPVPNASTLFKPEHSSFSSLLSKAVGYPLAGLFFNFL
jgi:hypothetical protein